MSIVSTNGGQYLSYALAASNSRNASETLEGINASGQPRSRSTGKGREKKRKKKTMAEPLANGLSTIPTVIDLETFFKSNHLDNTAVETARPGENTLQLNRPLEIVAPDVSNIPRFTDHNALRAHFQGRGQEYMKMLTAHVIVNVRANHPRAVLHGEQSIDASGLPIYTIFVREKLPTNGTTASEAQKVPFPIFFDIMKSTPHSNMLDALLQMQWMTETMPDPIPTISDGSGQRWPPPSSNV